MGDGCWTGCSCVFLDGTASLTCRPPASLVTCRFPALGLLSPSTVFVNLRTIPTPAPLTARYPVIFIFVPLCRSTPGQATSVHRSALRLASPQLALPERLPEKPQQVESAGQYLTRKRRQEDYLLTPSFPWTRDKVDFLPNSTTTLHSHIHSSPLQLRLSALQDRNNTITSHSPRS
jgi:hypothetical protein